MAIKILYQENEEKEYSTSSYEVIVRGKFNNIKLNDKNFYNFSENNFSMPSFEEAYQDMQLEQTKILDIDVLAIKGDFTYVREVLQILLWGYKKHDILSNIDSIHVINGIEGGCFPEELQKFVNKEKIEVSIITL